MTAYEQAVALARAKVARTCRHAYAENSRLRCYSYCAAGPTGDCDPRAHGSWVHTERCRACGSTRDVASNGCHSEASPWSLDPHAALAADYAREGDQPRKDPP